MAAKKSRSKSWAKARAKLRRKLSKLPNSISFNDGERYRAANFLIQAENRSHRVGNPPRIIDINVPGDFERCLRFARTYGTGPKRLAAMIREAMERKSSTAAPATPAVPQNVKDTVAALAQSMLENGPTPQNSEHSVPQGFASQVLDTVVARGNTYGSPSENHQTTADMLSSWLTRRLGQKVVLSAEDVCAINVIQKISRIAFCSKDDSWLDISGYTENVSMLKAEQRNRGFKKS